MNFAALLTITSRKEKTMMDRLNLKMAVDAITSAVSGGRLVLTPTAIYATDEAFFKYFVKIEDVKETVSIDGNKLKQFLSFAQAGDVEIVQDDSHIKMKCGELKCDFAVEKVSDSTAMAYDNAELQWLFSCNGGATGALNAALLSTTTKATLVRNCLSIESDGASVALTSTDNQTLSHIILKSEGGMGDVVIHESVVKFAMSLVGSAESGVSASFGKAKNNAVVKIMSTIDGVSTMIAEAVAPYIADPFWSGGKTFDGIKNVLLNGAGAERESAAPISVSISAEESHKILETLQFLSGLGDSPLVLMAIADGQLTLSSHDGKMVSARGENRIEIANLSKAEPKTEAFVHPAQIIRALQTNLVRCIIFCEGVILTAGGIEPTDGELSFDYLTARVSP